MPVFPAMMPEYHLLWRIDMDEFYKTLRHIHLDFHTPDFVAVGDQFDAGEFFDTLEEADVTSITVFAHCHHGHSYFNTQTGTRHPGLSFDLFGQMAEEAAKRPIQLMAYFSMNVNEVLAEQRPEWHALFADGKPVNSQILQDGTELFWTWLCPNRGPLMDEFLLPHIGEVLDHYPVDGVFVDMAGYLPGSCFCDACIKGMDEQGLDPHNAADHAKFNAMTIQPCTRSVRTLLDSKRPGLRLEMGGFNSFGEAEKAEGVLSNFYLESLAFQTGWDYFPNAARYFRNFNLPALGFTGRFLKNWGDFGTVVSPRQLKTQLSMHLMAGMGSGVGEHLHCNGRINKAVYGVIGEAFRFVKERQPYCVGMTPRREAAVVVPVGIQANAATMSADNPYSAIEDGNRAICKLMRELHLQYDLITQGQDVDLDDFGVVFINHGFFDAPFAKDVQAFVEEGGLAVACSYGLNPEDAEARHIWSKLFGISEFGVSEHQGEFYEVTDNRLLSEVFPKMPHYVHRQALDVHFDDTVAPLAARWRSPCVRSRDSHYGHFHGPAAEEAGVAIAHKACGKGHAIAIGPQVLAAYLHTGYFAHRLLLDAILGVFLSPERRVLKTNAPSIVEFSIGEIDGASVLQVMPFVADLRYRASFESVNEAISLHDIWVEVSGVGRAGKVRNAVTGESVSCAPTANGVRVDLPPFDEHQVFLIE
jgi:Hypothetical glycosyl hydrolase 6